MITRTINEPWNKEANKIDGNLAIKTHKRDL